MAKETTENSQVELRDVTPAVSGKKPLAAPPGSKGEATEPGPVNVCLPSSVDFTNYHVVFVWKPDKQRASLLLFYSIREVEGRVL